VVARAGPAGRHHIAEAGEDIFVQPHGRPPAPRLEPMATPGTPPEPVPVLILAEAHRIRLEGQPW
jgi:hypothetical protein